VSAGDAALGSPSSDPPSSQLAFEQPTAGEPSFPANRAFRPASLPIDEQLQAQRDRELELIGTERIRLTPPVHPAAVDPRHRLSPRWTAVFATLFGLCTVATLIAIAIQIDKRPHKIAPTAPSVSAQGSGTASPSSAVALPDRRPVRVKIPGPWRIRDAENEANSRIIEGRVGLDPLVKSVEKQGVPLKQFYRVIAAFSKVRPLTNCAKTDRYLVLLDRPTKRIKAFEYVTGNEEVFQAKEGNDGFLGVQKLDLQIKQARVANAVIIGDEGIEPAVLAGGFEKAIVATLREALSGHAALEELDRGTRLRIVAQELTTLGEFARYTGIEALEIDYPNDKQERIYYFVGPESRGYFDSAGRAPYSGGWRKPIPGAPITSHFNPHRMHPILKRVMPHEGTDFGSPAGTPVGASSFGTVTFVGFAGATGNFVRLSHPGDIETGYAHLSRFAEGLKVGDKVKRLQLIGYVGSTGRSTGPHLHFSAKRAGKFIDPESLNLDGLRTLEQRERPQFEQAKAEYNKLLEAIALPPPLNTPKPTTAAPIASVADGEELEIGEAPGAAATSTTPGIAPTNTSAAPRGNAVYLTDEELKSGQAASDDGEVTE
jgi:murein DD-endopeptidase MepM/ murein hydrolase activator NlpD